MKRTERLAIADALNEQASRFHAMAEDRADVPAQTREVWWHKAEENRALARKVIGHVDDEPAEWGRRAGASGLSRAVCPYAKGDAERAIWREAYDAAMRARIAAA